MGGAVRALIATQMADEVVRPSVASIVGPLDIYSSQIQVSIN